MKKNTISAVIYLVLILLPIENSTAQVFSGYESSQISYNRKKNKKRHQIKQMYSSGALKYDISYRKDELDGVTREYYENGTLKAEIFFDNNRRDKIAKFYYENGIIRCIIDYKRGIETGKAIYYSDKGVVISSTKKLRRSERRKRNYEKTNIENQ